MRFLMEVEFTLPGAGYENQTQEDLFKEWFARTRDIKFYDEWFSGQFFRGRIIRKTDIDNDR